MIPKEVEEEAEQILSFVGLYQKRNLRAGEFHLVSKNY
jgi:hypothetical protein